jgi:hypothetical protein
MGLLDGLGNWLKNEFDSITGQPQPAPAPQVAPQPQPWHAPMALPGAAPQALPKPPPLAPQPTQPNLYPNVAPGLQSQVQNSIHLNAPQKIKMLQGMNSDQPVQFNPIAATGQVLGQGAIDFVKGATQFATSTAQKAGRQFQYLSGPTATDAQRQSILHNQQTAQQANLPQPTQSLLAQAPVQGKLQAYQQVAQNKPISIVNQGLQKQVGAYNKQTEEGAGNAAQAALMGLAPAAEGLGSKVLGGLVDNPIVRKAGADILAGALTGGPFNVAGAAGNGTLRPQDIPSLYLQGTGTGILAGGAAGALRVAPLASDVVKSGVNNVADHLNAPAAEAAEKASGLSRNNILNDNDAGTLRDYADWKMGDRGAIRSADFNALDARARHAAETAGIDILHGSPRDIASRVENYISQRYQFIKTHDSMMQGGYAQFPFPEGNEAPIEPFAQEYAAEKSPQEIVQDHADMMRSLDKSARGGVILANGTRSSEHTGFYRQYFADNGRAPSKAAYVEQAAKELERGKGDMLDPDMATAYQLSKQRDAASAALAEHPYPEVKQESYYYGPDLNKGAFTAEDSTLADAQKPSGATRNPDAERVALNVLQQGGTRDEAIKAYQSEAGVGAKSARFSVQRAAKEAEQSLNTSKASPNPLLKDFELPKPKAGEFERVSSNHRAVTNSIDLAQNRMAKYEKVLSPADKSNLVGYIEGTKNISKADKPNIVQAAVDEWRRAADTVHALGENFGHTKHIQDFFPGYWERPPEMDEMTALQAQQGLEEEYGTQEWNNMRQDVKDNLIAQRQAELIGSAPFNNEANYGGFHNKSKTFKNQAEGLAAKYKPLFDNPFDAMRRYFNGAKLQLGNQSIIQGVRDAEPAPVGQRYGINLSGGEPVSVGKEGYKILKNESARPPASAPIRLLKGVNRSIVKTIVANPLIHGQNQEFNALFSAAWNEPGFKPTNMMRIIGNQMDLVKNPATYDKWRTDFYSHGGFSPDYGKNQLGFIAKAAQKVGISPNITEVSPRVMARLEENIRVATYKAGIEHGMAPDAALKAVNDALGSDKIINDMASSFGLFLHYLTNNVKILGNAGLSARRGNFSPIIGLALGYAAYTAANKAWQAITGNPDASVRAPGVIGTAQQLANAPGQLSRGQIPSVVTSHVNPLIRIGIEQATNRDLSKPVFGPEAPNNTLQSPSGNTRAIQILKDAVGPAGDITKLSQSKMSPAELAIGLGAGAYTPHATGYQASPNIKILNTPNAQSGNGLPSEQQYFNAKDAAISSLGNQKNVDDFNSFLDKDRTPDGKTILNSQAVTTSNWGQVAANPTALGALQKMYLAQNNHNPEWDLNFNGTISGKNTPALQIWATYKSLAPGDLQRDVIAQQNPWISNMEQQVSAWGAQQAKLGTAVQSPDYVPYPTLTPDQQNMMSTVTKLASIPAGQRTPEQISQLSTLENDPRLQAAYSATQQYTNQVRATMHLPQIQYAPNYSPEVQNFANAYLDPSLSSAQRKNLQAASPALYNQMEAALEQQELATVDKQGGIGYYGGNQSNGFLSSVYGLGNYDIAKIKNANGTNGYALLNFANNTGAGGTGQNGLATINANDKNAVTGAGSHYFKKQHTFKMRSPRRMKVTHNKQHSKAFLITPPSPIRIRNRVNKHVGIKRTTYL